MLPFPYRNLRCVCPKKQRAYCNFFLFCSVLFCWVLVGFWYPHHIIIHLFYYISFSSMLPPPLHSFLSVFGCQGPCRRSANTICWSTYSYHKISLTSYLSQGSNLRGKDFNLTLHWHVMPKTGKMFADKIVMTGYRLPDSYRWNALQHIYQKRLSSSSLDSKLIWSLS